MKATLYALFTAMNVVGCGSHDLNDPETLDKIIAEAIDEDKLQKRGKEGEELFYAPNEQTPYTGWSKSMYENEQVRELSQLKDGKRDGLLTLWYANGQKVYEGNLKDGKLDGLSTGWYENGQKAGEENFKDGKLVTATRRKPNGEKCPVTNLEYGNGVAVIYNEDGTEVLRQTYKDGVPVKD